MQTVAIRATDATPTPRATLSFHGVGVSNGVRRCELIGRETSPRPRQYVSIRSEMLRCLFGYFTRRDFGKQYTSTGVTILRPRTEPLFRTEVLSSAGISRNTQLLPAEKEKEEEGLRACLRAGKGEKSRLNIYLHCVVVSWRTYSWEPRVKVNRHAIVLFAIIVYKDWERPYGNGR